MSPQRLFRYSVVVILKVLIIFNEKKRTGDEIEVTMIDILKTTALTTVV